MSESPPIWFSPPTCSSSSASMGSSWSASTASLSASTSAPRPAVTRHLESLSEQSHSGIADLLLVAAAATCSAAVAISCAATSRSSSSASLRCNFLSSSCLRWRRYSLASASASSIDINIKRF
ncbi:hypothetical protein M758_UG241500 [Ceratodon purpureus]|nr:hypothetical protein M758_UG241500 [Ceratodon purpureus]